MNAREAMQALLDGKTLCNGNSNHYKLDSDGYIISKGDISAGNWYSTDILCMNGVVDEYPLTFEEALREMLDGKVVEVERLDPNLRFRHRFNRELSCFEFYSTSEDKWWMTHITECEQSCKWKVVE